MHGIAGLERGHSLPTLGLEQFTRLRWCQKQLGILVGKLALRQYLYRSRQVDWPLGHYHLYTRVFGMGGFIDARTLVGLIDRVFFVDPHGRHDFTTIGINQCDISSLGNVAGGSFIRR